MTKSQLIARLGARYPQLVAKDVAVAVNTILDVLATSLAEKQRVEIRGFGSFGSELPTFAQWTQSEVGGEGAGAGEVRAALQGRQETARASRP